MAEKKNNLRKDWCVAFLGEIAFINSGNTPKNLPNEGFSGPIPFYKVSDMNSPGNETRMKKAKVTLNRVDLINLKIKLEDADTIIFPKRGGAILTNKKRRLSCPAAYDLNLMGVKESSPLINNDYLWYWFVKLNLNHLYDGSNVPQINNKDIAPLLFPISPLPEQRRIVAKIEELFSELDKGVETLKILKQQVNALRQAVLKSAFEGKLTDGWRKDRSSEINDCDFRNIRNIEKNRIPNVILPNGWCWAMLNQLCAQNRKCAYGVLVPGDEYKNGVRLVRVGDIDRKGNVDTSSLKLIDPEIAKKYKRTFLQGGEVLMSLVGAIGRTAIASNKLKGSNTARAIGVIPISSSINSRYVELMLRSPLKYEEHNRLAHEVARKTLNLEDVEKSVIPLCSLKEQEKIVEEVESRLSVAYKCEETIEYTIQQSEALRQSILKKAFEGRLLSEAELEEVRNEPDWEPASVLLEKIKAHTAAADTSKPTSMKSARKGKKKA